MLGAFRSAKYTLKAEQILRKRILYLNPHFYAQDIISGICAPSVHKVFGAQRVIIAIKELNPDSYLDQLIPRL